MKISPILIVAASAVIVEEFSRKSSAEPDPDPHFVPLPLFSGGMTSMMAFRGAAGSLSRTIGRSVAQGARTGSRPTYNVNRIRTSHPKGPRRKPRPTLKPKPKPKSESENFQVPAQVQGQALRGGPKLRSLVKRSSFSKKNKEPEASQVSRPNTRSAMHRAEQQPEGELEAVSLNTEEKKKSKWQSTGEVIAKGLAGTSAIANQAMATAVQAHSLKLMGEMSTSGRQESSSVVVDDDDDDDKSDDAKAVDAAAAAAADAGSDEELPAGAAKPVSYYSRKSRVSEECPAAVDNAFVSVNRQVCPSSDADVFGDPNRSFSDGDERADDSEDDEAIDPTKIVWGTLKVTEGLVLRYRDYKKTKAYGQKGPYVCRREVMAVTDGRSGFAQIMQVIALTEVKKVELVMKNKKVAIACSSDRLPKSTLPPGQPRTRRPASETGAIPEVKVNKKRQLAWRGLVWATTKIKDSCHLDSFLTYILFKCKAYPTFMERNFLIPQDGYENVLKDLCRRFREFTPTDNKLMPVKKIHETWKGLWLRAFYPLLQKDVESSKIVYFSGHESESVGERLERSLVYMMVYSCSCSSGPVIRARKAFFPSLSLDQLRVMSRSSSGTSVDEPLGLALPLLGDACTGCTGIPVLNYIFAPTTSWLLYFYLGKAPGSNTYRISQIPKLFVLHELHVVGTVEFHLGYITVSTSADYRPGVERHQKAFMYFNSKFYLYDDANAGASQLEPDPDARLISDGLVVDSVSYFRI